MTDKAVIFDFDGTLADTFSLSVDIFYRLKPQPVLLPKKEVDRLRGMAMAEVVRELNIKWWEMPILLFRGKRMMAKRIHEAEMILGMDEVVKELHKKGYSLHVLSSNTPHNIRRLLTEHNLLQYFSTIQGNAKLHGKAKTLRKHREKRGGSAESVTYIGDEVRDVRAAQAAGVQMIAVSWGYNNLHALNESAPDHLVMEPDKILAILT